MKPVAIVHPNVGHASDVFAQLRKAGYVPIVALQHHVTFPQPSFVPLLCRVLGHRWYCVDEELIAGAPGIKKVTKSGLSHCTRCGVPAPQFEGGVK